MSVCVHCGSELPPAAAFCPACAQPGRAVQRPAVPAAPVAPRPPPPAPGLHPLLKQPFRDSLPPQTLSTDMPLDRRGPREGAPAAPPAPRAPAAVAPRPAAPAIPPLPRTGVIAAPPRPPAVPAPRPRAVPPPPPPVSDPGVAVPYRRRPTPSATYNWGIQPQGLAVPLPRVPAPGEIPVAQVLADRQAAEAALARTPEDPAVAAPPAPRASPPLQKVRAEVAPTWRRLLAWIADVAALLGVAGLFLWGAAALVHHGSPSRQSGLDWLAETLLAYRKLWIPGAVLVTLLAFLYLTLFTALGGQTPGKWLLRLRVIDRTGRCPSPVRSTLRAVFAVASGAMGLLGFFLVLVDRRGQALHDKLAGTFVVRSNPGT